MTGLYDLFVEDPNQATVCTDFAGQVNSLVLLCRWEAMGCALLSLFTVAELLDMLHSVQWALISFPG